MPLCRVYRESSGALRIFHPNPKKRLDGEPEADFLERMAARAVEADRSLRRLAHTDLDTADLPPRDEPCSRPGCAERHPVRDAWRITGGRVAVDRSLPNPHVERAHAALDLDDELAKPSPDLLKALRLQRQLSHPPQAPPRRRRKGGS